MARWPIVALALLLGGCATHRDYYYDDGYYADGSYYDGGYRSSYRDSYRGYAGDSYYSPGYGGYGDYWYGEPDYRYSGYLHWPAYYSVYWPMNRWFYDPYWYPGYYYGVTFFPRNYLSLGISYGWPRHGGYFAYSPYRYGWTDWYYDWYPYYAYNPRYRDHYRLPRHGSARHEAERLAHLSGATRFGERVAKREAAGLLAPARAQQRGAARGPGRDGGAVPARDIRRDARALPGREAGTARTLPQRGGERRAVDDTMPARSPPAIGESRRVYPQRDGREQDLRRTLREEGVPLRTRTRTVTIPARTEASPGRGERMRAPDAPVVRRDYPQAQPRADQGRGYQRGYERGYERSYDRASYGGDAGYAPRAPMPVREHAPAPVQRDYARQPAPSYGAPSPSYSPPPAREPPSRSPAYESRSDARADSAPSSRSERGSERGSARGRRER
ncbi:MAG TPA: hypothetical protein VFG21_05890 [Xanthomonadaceae bacterium]|nr:hypothetical protein [Xanthomonadaceae bacterium]